MINVIIVFFYFWFSICFGRLLRFGYKIIAKKELFTLNIVLITCLILMSIYLFFAYYKAHHVIETNYNVSISKESKIKKLRIAQITDSHIGATMDGEGFYNYTKIINEKNPDIVVITGDFVDDDSKKEDMIRACEGLKEMNPKYGKYFIFGNHDKGYFDKRDFNQYDLRKEFEKSGVKVLEDEFELIDDAFYIAGRQDRSTRGRLDVGDIVKDVDNSKFILTLDHQPNDYENEKNAKLDLVLSGHSHGGQINPVKWIDKFFKINDRNYGIEKRDNTTFIVSSGIGDWVIKFRTGSVAEYVIIDVDFE